MANTPMENMANSYADILILSGVVAHLFAKSEPDEESRIAAFKKILGMIAPEIDARLNAAERMAPHVKKAEQDRLHNRSQIFSTLVERALS